MTTIAYCHKTKVIAYDGFVVSGNEIMSVDCKKYAKKGDLLFFGAGNDLHIDEFIEFYLGGKLKIDDFSMSMILVDGKKAYKCGYCKDSKLTWKHELVRHYAIGSGGYIAQGALYSGKTAIESVKIASQIDINTGGKFRSYNILTGKHG